MTDSITVTLALTVAKEFRRVAKETRDAHRDRATTPLVTRRSVRNNHAEKADMWSEAEHSLRAALKAAEPLNDAPRGVDPFLEATS